jgi:hypothetical protein
MFVFMTIMICDVLLIYRDLYADLCSDFTDCCIYLEALRVLLTGTRGGTRHLRTFIFSGV